MSIARSRPNLVAMPGQPVRRMLAHPPAER
jgi:hypothetical protein